MTAAVVLKRIPNSDRTRNTVAGLGVRTLARVSTPVPLVIDAAFLADPTLTMNDRARTLSQRLSGTAWPAQNRQIALLINDLNDFDQHSEQYGDIMCPWYTAEVDFGAMIQVLNIQAKHDGVWIATMA